MARVDRILDLLEYLRAHDVTTVAMIAAELEVSPRTILRDLATLRDRGWPIRSESGPGGGVVLERDRGVAAVHLTIDQIVSLWLAAQLSASVSTLPWSVAARAALDKVFASVPKDRAKALRRLVKRVVVGQPASARIREELKPASPDLLVPVERAFAESLCLAFDYVDRHGRKSRRCVEPHGLLVEAPAWYLLTRDTASGEARMFRMDRIRRAEIVATRPFAPDFEGLRAQAYAQRGLA